MSNRKLIVACYRSLLGWSQILKRVPIQIRKEHLKTFSPQMVEAKLSLEDSRTFRNFIRWSFRSNLTLTCNEANEAQSRAVTAVRLLNSVYRKQIEELEAKRRSHLDLNGIHFAIGQVVKHRENGYRGVVYGWDRVCQFPQYITNQDVDFVQPFYNVIPDETDCIRSFGGPRMFQYIAQTDIVKMETPNKITNRSLISHFESYDPLIGRYIPKAHLQFEYPDDYGQGEKLGKMEELSKKPEDSVNTSISSQDADQSLQSQAFQSEKPLPEDNPLAKPAGNIGEDNGSARVEESDKVL